MSKAVLVIDMPEDMEIKDTKAIQITLFNGLFTKDISNIACQLRPLPEKGTMENVEPCAYNQGFVDGGNFTIDLITGENK